MRNIFLIFGILLAYTLLYAGVSHFWHGVTAFQGAVTGGSGGP